MKLVKDRDHIEIMLRRISAIGMIKRRDNTLGQTPPVGVLNPNGVMAYK
jgi:hypothetical protein